MVSSKFCASRIISFDFICYQFVGAPSPNLYYLYLYEHLDVLYSLYSAFPESVTESVTF